MEISAGPSDKYEITENQIQVESLINECFNVDIVNRQQLQSAVDYVHARWIEYAYQWGDETVFEFLDPEKPPYPALVTYHHLLDERKNENIKQETTGG